MNKYEYKKMIWYDYVYVIQYLFIILLLQMNELIPYDNARFE